MTDFTPTDTEDPLPPEESDDCGCVECTEARQPEEPDA